MGLPKGTVKGLARVVSPLCFWMAAGWAAYPYMMQRIMDIVGEAMDVAEAKMFSWFMVTACVAAGIALAIYGYSGKDASAEELAALAGLPTLCPYCGNPLPEEASECPQCRKTIPK